MSRSQLLKVIAAVCFFIGAFAIPPTTGLIPPIGWVAAGLGFYTLSQV